MIMKKKQLLSATLVIALGAAVAVNWYYTKNPIDTTQDTTGQEVSGNLGDSLSVGSSAIENETTEAAQSVMAKKDFFATERLKRDESYDEMIDSVEEVLESDKLSQEKQDEISDKLDVYMRNIKAQSDTESLISAKTGGDCIVVINGEICQVILEKNTLNEGIILQISDIIEKNTNISAKNLTIIEAK
ncbi:MAG: SpoIIIAH-like family protein [Ruminococcaceae bacterium]|nr:SpoIIIAH-like family protein [Oscillospiraceae bacterium]